MRTALLSSLCLSSSFLAPLALDAAMVADFPIISPIDGLDMKSLSPSLKKDFEEGRYEKIVQATGTELEEGKSGNVSLTLSAHLEALRLLNRQGGVMDFESIKDNLLKKFPKSAEYCYAIGQAYFSLPDQYSLVDGKYQRLYRWTENAISNQYPDIIAGLYYIHKAFTMALDQGNNQQAAQYAYALASRLDSNDRFKHSFSRYGSYNILSELTNISVLPTPDAAMPSIELPKTDSNSLLLYSTPASWETAKNDGERILWLIQEAKKLDPSTQSQQCDLLWAKIISQVLTYDQAGLGYPLHDTKITTQRSQLKPNEYLFIPQKETRMDREQQVGIVYSLEGLNNYLETYRQILAKDPSNIEVVDLYAKDLWNRSQFEEAVQVIKTALANSVKIPLNEDIKYLIDTEKALTSPNIEVANRDIFNKIVTSIPKDGFKIPVQYHNSPDETWTVTKLDLDALTEDQLQELQSLKSVSVFNKKLDQYQANEIIRAFIDKKKWIQKYLSAPTEIKAQYTTDQRYRWYSGEMSVPITEPGLYLVNQKNRPLATLTIIQYNPVSYSFKQTITGYEYICYDQTSGKPITNATGTFTIWERGDRRYSKKNINISCNENGIFKLPLEAFNGGSRNLSYIGAVISYGDKKITIPPTGGWSNYLPQPFSKEWNAQYMAQGRVSTYCLLNQPIYKAGSEIKGRIVVSQYQLNDPKASITAGIPIKLSLSTPRGNKVNISKQPYYLDEFGAVDFSIRLPEDGELGSYRLEVTTNDPKWKDQVNHIQSIQVEEFVKPDFKANISIKDKNIEFDKPFTVDFLATYYAGGPLIDGKVHYTLSLKESFNWWRPQFGWDWFEDSSYNFPYNTRSKTLRSGELTLNDRGEASFTFTPTDNTFGQIRDGYQKWTYEITANFVDASGKSIEAKSNFPVDKFPFVVSHSSNTQFAEQGQDYAVKWEATSSSGARIPNVQGTLYLVAKQNDKEDILTSWDIKFDDQGVANWSFTPEFAGEYELRGEWKNQAGQVSQSSDTLLIAGSDVRNPFKEARILTDKKVYSALEPVKLLVTTTQPDGYVWLQIREGWPNATSPIIQTTNGSHILSIPTTEQDRPNFNITACNLSGETLPLKAANVLIPPTNTTVVIEAKSNHQTYEPGTEGNIVVQVKLPSGEPVKNTEITLSVYDEALDYFGIKNNPSLLRQTWGAKNSFPYLTLKKRESWYRVYGNMPDYGFGMVYKTRRMMYDDGPFGPLAAPCVAMTKASNDYFVEEQEKPEESTQEVKVRDKFEDSIKWVGNLKTDANGEAIIPIKLPDNLTTWKIVAWARTADLKVGQTTSSFICNKELMINPNTPRFLVQGDLVTSSALVRNQSNQAMKLDVSLELKNGHIITGSPLTQQIEVPANGQQVISWNLEAKSAGEANMIMKAVGEKYSDAVEITYPILEDGARVCHQASTILIPGDQSGTITVNIPQERKEETTSLSVGVSPTLALMMVDAIPYLTYYPYECSEQTANRVAPALQVIQTLQALGYKPQAVLSQLQRATKQGGGPDNYAQILTKLEKNPVFNEVSLNEKLNKAIRRLRNLQKNDGGWAWFSPDTQSNPLITAYVLEALAPIDNNGEIQSMKNRAQNYLIKQANKAIKLLVKGDQYIKKDKKVGDNFGPYQLEASSWDVLIYSLLDDKEDERGNELESYLWRDRYKLPISAQLKLANIYVKEGKQEKVADLMPLFMQYLKQDEASQLAWLNISDPTWWNWDCNKIAIQAEFLNLLVQTAPQGSEQEKIMIRVAKWLAENRSYGNYWESTRTTGQVINALSAYCLRTKEGMETMSVDVYMDGKLLKTITSTPETIFDYDSTITLTPEQLKSGTYNLEFKRKEGKGNIYASAQWEYFSLENPIPAAGNQAVIERAYYRLIPQGLNEQPKRELLKWGDSVNQGDVIDVILTLNTKNDIKFLMVRDPLPAGFANTEQLSTYDWRQGAFKELDVEETRWFYENLPQGKRQINYQLRAQRSGKFSALPSVIEAMYAPQLRGNSREDEIKVNGPNQ